MSIIRLIICKVGKAELYKNRAEDGRNNICGKNVKRLRQGMAKDIELKMMASVLDVSVDALLSDPND